MPIAFSAEFRQNVIDTVKESGAPHARLAKDFGVSVSTLKRWLEIDRRAGAGSVPRVLESVELREAKKRLRLLEQENEILRRAAAYLSQANLKLGQSPK